MARSADAPSTPMVVVRLLSVYLTHCHKLGTHALPFNMAVNERFKDMTSINYFRAKLDPAYLRFSS